MFQRQNEFNKILRQRRLFKQNVVDQYCKVETERLSCFCQNQVGLCAADYSTLFKKVGDPGSTGEEVDAGRTDRMLILLSTFISRDRYMRQTCMILSQFQTMWDMQIFFLQRHAIGNDQKLKMGY